MTHHVATSGSRLPPTLLALYGVYWMAMAIAPLNRRDWALENLLVVVLVPALVFTYRRFQFSNGSYLCIALFMTLHTIGAHYTYAEVPVGFWVQEVFHLSRNPFDRFAHFAYGFLFVPPLREVFLRLARVRGGWASALSIAVTLAQSALFEIGEAVVAEMVSPELGSAYLGIQGDQWDAQKDIAAAFIGALLMVGLIAAKSKRVLGKEEAFFWEPRKPSRSSPVQHRSK